MIKTVMGRAGAALAMLAWALAVAMPVSASGLKNVALGLPITPLTDTVQGNPTWVTNGDIDNVWYSYQGNPSFNSFTIDLGASYAIDSVNLQISQVYGYEIYSSDNGTAWTLRSKVDFGTSRAGAFTATGGYTTRYLKYWAYANWPQYVGIAELQVCVPDASPTPYTCALVPAYTVGGNASGLTAGDTLVLRNNGADNLNVTTNGGFTFGTYLPNGAAYAVTVATNPAGKSCSVTQGTGTMGSANVTDVSVACVPINVALNKPTSASGSYSIYVPSRGNDGVISTIWNGGDIVACWQVDLQAVYLIQTVVVTSNQWGGSTIFQVASSLDGNVWTNVGAQTTGSDAAPLFSFDTSGAAMRHLRFCTLPGGNQWATLSELEAYGVPATTYTLTYDGNGNTGGTAPVDPASPYVSGATVTVQAAGTLTRTGFVFSEWNTAANGSGLVHSPGGTFAIAANTTLYAQWTALPVPSVTGIAPTSGAADGGTNVIISGTNFVPVTIESTPAGIATAKAAVLFPVVSLGGAGCAVVNASNSQITCVTGAHAPGLVDVAVTTEGGTGTLPSAYLYVAPPPTTIQPVPTTSEAVLMLMSLLLLFAGGWYLSRRVG